MTNRRVRVTHVSTVHPWDDIRIFRRQCRSLARHGYDVTLIAVGDGSRVEEGVAVVAVPRLGRWRRVLLGLPRALRLSWATRADAYHLHDPELIPLIPLLRLRGAAVVYDGHEDLPVQVADKPYLPRPAVPAVSLAARALCAVARSTASHVVTATPTIARRFGPRTTVLHNYPEPLPDIEDDGGYAGRSDTVIYVGGITEPRGAREMVDAVAGAGLPAGWRLTLVGPEPAGDLLAALRTRAGWSRVDYRGRVDAVTARRLMGTAKIGLVVFQPTPAHVDALPSKLFEYMAAGLPIVASDFPLWRSIIESAGCGVVVDPTDPAAISRALRDLISRPDRAEQMGRRGRAAARERYSWAHEERKLVGLYATLCPPAPVSAGAT